MLMFCIGFCAAAAQEPTPAPIQVKTITAPQPVFPAEAADPVYGDTVRVSMHVDNGGKVKEAVVYGPLVSCSDLKDPVAAAIRRAAEEAGKATVFEPILKNGKPIEATTSVTFRLRQGETAIRQEQPPAIVSEKVLRGKAVSLPEPKFPHFLLDKHSFVSISVRINEKGVVSTAGALSGRADLLELTTEAACASRFSPTKIGGRPVKVQGIITYGFHRSRAF